MQRVLIVSDSHGLSEEVQTIKERHRSEVQGMIHCGDSELDFDASEMDGYQKVRGNCDFDERYQEELSLQYGDLSFFATHGHLYQVKSTLMPLSYRADELGAQVVCFGHSHIAGAEKVNNKLFINPGSIRLPRGRKERTYAILSWENLNSIKLDFYNEDGEIIPSMTFVTNLQTGE